MNKKYTSFAVRQQSADRTDKPPCALCNETHPIWKRSEFLDIPCGREKEGSF